ncbi:MAG TPA: hypothetical protein VFQ38_02655 [Longimicrobiales bacterium]|nr:hypothetical protein [Longimicrobiales bacterium]
MRLSRSRGRAPRRARQAAPWCGLAALMLAAPAVHAQQPAAAPDSGAALAAAPDSAATATAALFRDLKPRTIGPAVMNGRITALAVPETPGHKLMYAGSAGGGLWKTANAGVTWEPVFTDQGFASIGDVAVAPSNPEIVWVGTGERNSLRSSGWGDGVYKSTDGGKTWKRVGLEDSRQTGRIVVHPKDPDVVYVAALGHLWGPNPERGVFKTVDGGKSWRKVLFVDDTTGAVDLKMDPSNPEVLYAATWHRLRWGGNHMEGAGAGSGIWKTTDGGRSWKRLTDPALRTGLPTEPMGRIGLAISPRNPRTLYAVAQVARGSTNPRLSPEGGLFRSDDAGASWSRVNDLSAIPDYYYNEVWVDPSDEQKLWLTATTLDYSKDGGKSIATLRLERVHSDHHALWIDPSDSEHMVLGNDGGVYITFDGGKKWAHQVIPIAQFYEADLDTTRHPYHVCGGMQDNGVWCGPSQTRERIGITDADWYQVYGGDGMRSAVAPDSPTTRYAEFQFGTLSRWDINEWRYVSIQPQAEDAGVESGFEFRYDWNSPFIVSAHDPTVLYFGGNHLFRFTDRGRTWRILGPDMTRQDRRAPEPDVGHTGYHALHSIAESPLDRNVLWTGSDDGLLWTSSDAGRTWRNLTAQLPDTIARRCVVSEIAASRFDARRAYVAYDCHDRDDYRPRVFRTTDAGATFVDISGDLPPDAGSHVVLEDPRNPNLLYVGTERGLYLTLDGGRRWHRLKSGLPTVAVRDLDLVPSAGDLVVPTFGRGVWILDVAALEQLTDSILARPAALLAVRPARQFQSRDTYGEVGDAFFRGQNPPYGARIGYWLAKDLGKDVTLTIKREAPAGAKPPVVADGRGARAAPTKPDGAQAPGQPQPEAQAASAEDDVVATLTGSGRPGLHVVSWDLRSKEPRPREMGGPLDRDELRRVPAGRYTVTLKVGDATLEQPILVEDGWFERSRGPVR